MNYYIIKTEAENDGSTIHLYWENSLKLWMSYGRSAYSLRLLLKSNGLDSLRNFTAELNLPCTMTTEAVVRSIYTGDYNVSDKEGCNLSISVPKEFTESDYKIWEEKLLIIEKSSALPNDMYIYDNMSSVSRNAKRIIDLIASSIALIVFSPAMLACYIAIKIEDGGPAIFKQERIGRFGKPFNIYKFRSMKMDAEQMGPQLSSTGGKGDIRLTKVGRFLRSHHLDELPQLWNVFCGDMAFVGPRPERKFYIDQILEHDTRYTYLYQIRPGVTSYATLYNGYTDTMEKMLARLKYDLYYLKHRTLLKDMSILFKTFCKIIFGKIF